MKTLCRMLGLLAFAVIASSNDTAFAAGWRTCNNQPLKWQNNSFQLRAASGSFPVGVWRNALSETVSRWNSNPSKFYFNLTYEDTNVALNNGESETWFSSDDTILAGAPAIAYTRWSCPASGVATYIEADIITDNRVAYTTSTSTTSLIGYGGSNRPFQTTNTHELGHSLGLNHENRDYNVMGQDWTHIHTNNNTSLSYPGENASHGAVILYGLYSSPLNDLSVSHWKYLSASGEYSSHQRTQIFNSANALLPSFTVSGERIYPVNRGQQVLVEFTFENNGANTQNPRIGFYLSSNNNISTTDTLIASASLSLTRDYGSTQKYYVTIPSNIATGRYWIGAIVDDQSAISETDESNNSTYTAIDVR